MTFLRNLLVKSLNNEGVQMYAAPVIFPRNFSPALRKILGYIPTFKETGDFLKQEIKKKTTKQKWFYKVGFELWVHSKYIHSKILEYIDWLLSGITNWEYNWNLTS